MTITTKAGDRGTTAVKGGRILKSDPLIEALGALDECSSLIIYMQAELKLERAPWELVVNELYQISSYLSGYAPAVALDEAIARFEAFIKTKAFVTTRFIFPFDDRKLAMTHYVRTVARRAERCLVLLNQSQEMSPQVLIYMNRLSDYIFANEL